jgi:hypothetical protein
MLTAARESGVSFGDAWPTVLDSIGDERWREALAQTAGTWKRAYMLEPPTAADVAVDFLSRGIAGELSDLDAVAHCPVCDAEVVPVLRGAAKVFCSHRCKRIADARRDLQLDLTVSCLFPSG